MLAISQGTAICFELLTAFLWGSWYQTIKRTGEYPMPAFMIWIYLFSNLIIWGVTLGFRDIFVPEGIFSALRARPDLAGILFVGGIFFGLSMQVSMHIMSKLGIILSISISATLGIFTGTFIPMFINGLPDNVMPGLMVICALIFLAATLLCQFSGVLRDLDAAQGARTQSVQQKNKPVYLLFVLNIFLGLGYPISMSLGMRSVTNPQGLPSMLACSVLCVGALAGTLVLSGVRLARMRALHTAARPGGRILWLAFFSAVGHFGGNVTQMIAAPVLSLAVAWPLSTTSHMWSYFWGIVYGEYRGCSKRAGKLLALGIACFAAGVLFLTWVLYGNH